MTTNLIKRDEWDIDPFDFLWKNFFEEQPKFSTLINKVGYPVDIFEDGNNVIFEIAAVNLTKDDIKISVERGDTLRIKYDKSKEDDRKVIYRGITRKSFDLAWKISSKWDLSKLDASLEKGLLKISIPAFEEQKPKQIDIKIKD